jgi:hypothetical protein
MTYFYYKEKLETFKYLAERRQSGTPLELAKN